MRQTSNTSRLRRLMICLPVCLAAIGMRADDGDVFERIVHISGGKGAVFELLEDISRQTGYLFVYDSQLVNNDRRVTIPDGDYTLRNAIRLITGNDRLVPHLQGEYVLLRLPGEPARPPDRPEAPVRQPHFTVGGALSDSETGKPVTFASVSVVNTTTGTVSNRDGAFQLTLPDSLRRHKVRFSHIGYESVEIDPAASPEGKSIRLALKPQFIPLQEIVVGYTNPVQMLNDMLSRRPANYSSVPVYLTSFYREGIRHRRRNTDMTESVLQIYKTGYGKPAADDQVRLVKKRRFVDRQKTDTIFPRMRSGINSCLILDIMKELPDFISPGSESLYIYAHKGMDIVDGRIVNVILFRQKDYIREPLYAGELYIARDTKALVAIRFEVNPVMIGKATNMFVDKKAAGLRIELRHAGYLVSYRPAEDGTYHISHVRGDIGFRVRRKNRLFSSPLDFWFEMVTCRVDTADVKPFPRNERLSPTRIFAETKHGYDRDFWNNFNIIPPEENLTESLINNLNEILISY
ncbi:MAG: carboxypeptidase-like regulatory domain-containing protein [Tannerella sp.]|jgi:hypothetical protein|nr:carboxypeptidase-like regulatory domain-containing protein [Tannerella sp.]